MRGVYVPDGTNAQRKDVYQKFFFVLLTVHPSIFILIINQLYAQNFVLQ